MKKKARKPLQNIFFQGVTIMTNYSPHDVKQMLLDSIDSLLDHREEFFTNPASDFTKTKKISFAQTLLFPMVAASDNLPTELLDFFDEEQLPSSSAIIQRRNQVKSSAFQHLFHLFTEKINVQKRFRGYRLLAFDGSRINLPYNPSDPETFISCIRGRRGINQIHLNALYDILNDIFIDAELHSVHCMNEDAAFCHALDHYRSSIQKAIYIADRGLASYNTLAHAIHNQQLILIRAPHSFVKDLMNGEDSFMQEEFVDRDIMLTIGRRRTKVNLAMENYHFISKSRRYDFIPSGSDQTETLKIRLLKFPLSEDTSEYIVTNLPQYSFSLATIKELYRLRWGIETAFRHLKYAGNMTHMHSLKHDFHIQEIYAKLTMYNVCSFIAMTVAQREKETEKHNYVINHTQLQKICIRFLKGKVKDVISLISRNMVPNRPGRSFRRRLRTQSADTLNYR